VEDNEEIEKKEEIKKEKKIEDGNACYAVIFHALERI